MKFIADENVDRQVVERLREAGHLVSYVAEIDPGTSDEDVLAIANREAALLLTADRDFGELIFRQRHVTTGVVLVRLGGQTQTKKAEIITSALRKHDVELIGAFTVITPHRIRIRYPRV